VVRHCSGCGGAAAIKPLSQNGSDSSLVQATVDTRVFAGILRYASVSYFFFFFLF
jgi:pyruvate/2-oxoacid:ferredoxin oxidoreductase beta subunit